MDRLKWISILLIFFSFGAQAKGLHVFVEWQDQNRPLNERLSKHNTLFVSTYQKFKNDFVAFNSSFKTKGLKIETVMTDRDQSPIDSTGDIVKAIRDSREKQNLVCVGKAAADCLEALLQYPKLWRKISYFISLDGKISGAEYAENSREPVTTHDVQKASKFPLIEAFRFLMDAAYSLWDGHDPAVYSMSPKVRQAYLQEVDSQIENMTEEIHVISMVTEKGPYWKIPHSRTQYFVSN